jgi:hypothetical protein
MAYEADEWEGRDEFLSAFGKASNPYAPRVDMVERHPDKRPSSSDATWRDDKAGLTTAMEVRGECGGLLGVVLLRASNGHPDGKLRFEGLSIFTQSELLFE